VKEDQRSKISMTDQGPLTISVSEAGDRYFGMSRGASYEAAKRGDIPTVRVGRLLRVPVRALEAMLDNAGQKSSTTFKKSTAIRPTPTAGSGAPTCDPAAVEPLK